MNGVGENNTTESASNLDGEEANANEFVDTNLSVEEEVIMLDSLFGIMGEYGTCIMIYSSDSIILKHQIFVGHVIRSF